MDLDIEDLKALMRGRHGQNDDTQQRVARRAARAGAEGSALELAVAAIEILRDTGSINGAQICRLAEYLGFDGDAILRAWKIRGAYDFETTRYGIDAPIAKIVPLQ